jgi:hypothetical protein
LSPTRLICDRCGRFVSGVTGPDVSDLEHLTAHQVVEFFPEAADEAEQHEVLCGTGGRD